MTTPNPMSNEAKLKAMDLTMTCEACDGHGYFGLNDIHASSGCKVCNETGRVDATEAILHLVQLAIKDAADYIIGEDDPFGGSKARDNAAETRNELRAAQRKRLAEFLGLEEPK